MGTFDAGVVGRLGVAAVHEVVGHELGGVRHSFTLRESKLQGGTYVDIVNRRPNLRPSNRSVGNHVGFLSGDGDREELVGANRLANGSEDLWVRSDLSGLCGVGHLLVVCAVASRVLPVDVCLALVHCVLISHRWRVRSYRHRQPQGS